MTPYQAPSTETNARVLDGLFWGLSVLVVLSALLAGCGFFQAAGEVAVTPNPNLGGRAPLDVVGEAVPDLIVNPTSPTAWWKVLSSLGTIIVGGGALWWMRRRK